MGRGGFKIAKLFGINIRVDWSWLIILALIVWNLAIGFETVHPDWAGTLRWGVALVAAFLFFASVLAHELAHSLVARSHGVPVRNITLFLFGGVSNIQQEPKSPGNEFTMAIVGPLTSIIVGGILVGIGFLVAGPEVGIMQAPGQALADLGVAETLLFWLGSVNIILGVFNLIPGFPLDGGRVLRSILWGATDNLRTATRWASWTGQAIAWTMILAGIAAAFGVDVPIVGEGLVNGLWFAFIGWFLSNAAVQGYRRVVIHDILEDVPVREMMRRDPPVVAPNATVSALVHDHIMGTDDHSFPVVQGDELRGVVTLEDVREIDRDRWQDTYVREIMTPREELVTVTPETSADEAFDELMQRDVGQLPVISEGHLVGLLRRRDVVRWLRLHSELGQDRMQRV
jgi:Zn-dependent protease